MYYEKLTENRKRFVDQLMPLIESTFDREIEEEERIKTISIDASWGMGKTLLKDVLVEKLTEKEIKVKAINAWETDYFSDPMKSLIGEINESDLNISSDTIEKGEKLIKNIGGVATKIFGTALLKKLNFTDEDITNIKSIFQGIDSSGVEEYKKYKDLVKKFKESFGVSVGTSKRIIILDELDRCKPNYAIELLEAIKHIFDIYNLTFIFLINKEQLKHTVENLYGCNMENEDYFEKFFDIQFKLPEIDIKNFLEIEYENYDYNNLYSVEFEFEKIMISLLFSSIKVNDFNFYKNSIRELKKSLNKYKYIIKTFTEYEKRSLLMVLGFIGYFIYEEFNVINTGLNINNIYKFNIKSIFEGVIFKEKNQEYEVIESRAIPENSIKNFLDILKIDSRDIKFKRDVDEADINRNFLICFYSGNEISLPLDNKFIKKYKMNSLSQWCKEKYEFTHYIG